MLTLTTTERESLESTLVEKWETPVTDPVFPELWSCALDIFNDEYNFIAWDVNTPDYKLYGRRGLALRKTLDIIRTA